MLSREERTKKCAGNCSTFELTQVIVICLRCIIYLMAKLSETSKSIS